MSTEGAPPPRSHHERLDVDTRFLLANERTLLAWVRTGLSLIAVGLAVLQFGTGLQVRLEVGGVFLLMGSAASFAGWRRYAAADSAIREGRMPEHGRAPQALALAIAGLGVVLLVILLLLQA
jgi:putative membrane protein